MSMSIRDLSCFIIRGFHIDMQGVFGENTGRFLRPFHKTDVFAVQAIFHPRLRCFLFIFQPVKINMKNPFGLVIFSKNIFIYN